MVNTILFANKFSIHAFNQCSTYTMTVLYFEDSYADNIYNLEKKYLHQENILHGNLIAAAYFLFK